MFIRGCRLPDLIVGICTRPSHCGLLIRSYKPLARLWSVLQFYKCSYKMTFLDVFDMCLFIFGVYFSIFGHPACGLRPSK